MGEHGDTEIELRAFPAIRVTDDRVARVRDAICTEKAVLLYLNDRVLTELGPERVIFGSDVSGTSQPFFNFPKVEREKVESLELTDAEHDLIFGANILRLISRTPAGERLASVWL